MDSKLTNKKNWHGRKGVPPTGPSVNGRTVGLLAPPAHLGQLPPPTHRMGWAYAAEVPLYVPSKVLRWGVININGGVIREENVVRLRFCLPFGYLYMCIFLFGYP